LDLSQTSSLYFRTASYIFDWVQATNDAGVHFPLHGHCMGFQLLAILAAGSNSSVLLSNAFDSEDLSLALDWTHEAESSKWVQRMPNDVRMTYTYQASTTNLHHDGVSPQSFNTNSRLPMFFNVLSTNLDRKGRSFISTMESKAYPIFAVQWHPERNQFEWRQGRNINHGADAVAANAWMARDFIDDSRKHPARNRSWGLLRKLATHAMDQLLVGDVLDGVAYLMFGGFQPNASAQLPATVVNSVLQV